MNPTSPILDGPGLRGPRRLLRRIRDLMAVQEHAQARLDRLTSIIAEETGSDVCSIYLVLPDGALELSATHGLKAEAVHSLRLAPDEGLVGLVARRARPIAVENAPAHPNFAYKPETGEEPFKSFVGVPVLRGGRLVGVLTAQTMAVRRSTEEEIETLQTVAMLLAEIVVSGELLRAEAFSEMELRPTGPERFTGLALSSGIAVGTAVVFEPHVVSTRMIAEDAEAEEERLDAAIGELRRGVDELLDSGRAPIGTPSRDVLEAYRMFAHDRGWIEQLREAVRSGLTAEAAVERVRNEHRARLMKAREAHFRERLHDLEDLANRLLRHLSEPGQAFTGGDLPDNAILIARSIGPAELMEMDRTRLVGLALEEGSATSHAAIVAKALGIPMVGKVEGALDRVEEGDTLIVDGEFGLLHIRPGEEALGAYHERLESLAEASRIYAARRDEPALTADGVLMDLQMNAGLLVELPRVAETGASGVGLFRTEFQFMVSSTLPRLEAQMELYRAVLDAVGDRPVVFRTLDLGGDKVTAYTPVVREPNPALGWRALRMGLDRPALTRYQLRALVRAAAGRTLKVLFPMVTAVEELAAARGLLDLELDLARKHGHALPERVETGLMIETPSVAFDPDPYLKLCDFAAVGANDLMQYFFAADRQNPHVSARYDVVSPSALRLLATIREACDRAQKPVSVCGEIASQPLEACILSALGYRKLSMAAASIGPVKTALAECDTARLGTWLAREMALDGPQTEKPLRDRMIDAAQEAGLSSRLVDKRAAF
ncbi:MAG: phosphoenolpyruvate--protein phosphotransferase [Glycocaulis sp.]